MVCAMQDYSLSSDLLVSSATASECLVSARTDYTTTVKRAKTRTRDIVNYKIEHNALFIANQCSENVSFVMLVDMH